MYLTITSPTLRPAACAGLPEYTSVIVNRQVSLGTEQGFPSDPQRANSIPIPALESAASNCLKKLRVDEGCNTSVLESSRDASIASAAARAAVRVSSSRSISAHTSSNSGDGKAQGGGLDVRGASSASITPCLAASAKSDTTTASTKWSTTDSNAKQSSTKSSGG